MWSRAKRPPGAADGIEVAAPALLQPVDLGKLGIDDLARLFEAAARGVDQPQAAERKGGGVRQPAASHVDQLQAAAAEVAGKTVGRMDARHHAKGGKLGLLGAGENGDLPVEDALGLGDEFRPVGGLARRRRGDDLDMGDAELVDQGAKTPERPERALHGVGRQLAGRERASAPARTRPSR